MARQRKYNGYMKKTFTYNGKRYYIYGKTSKELLEKEVEKRQQLEKGLNSIVNPTLNEYYDIFTNIRRRELRESTLRSQKCQFENIAKAEITKGICFGDLPIKKITRRDIERVREILLSSGKTPQNLNNCFAHLNHVFSCALIDETIEKNPCKALKPLKRTAPLVSETKHRALSVKETQLFFEKAEARNSYYINAFLIMIKTGMRVGEVTALHRTDIDRKKGFIHVTKTIARDEVGGYYVSNNPKTANGNRDIPLTEEIYAIIKAQEQLNRMIFGGESTGLLFKSVEGKILREYTLNREIKRICEDAKIEPFTCHCFRNTFATRWIEQRPEDYKILSEILGHKDVSITLNLYTHVMQENKVRAMNEVSVKTG